MTWPASRERYLETMALLSTPKAFNVPQAIQQALDFHRQGQLPQAEKLYAEVLAVRPDYFEALHRLGLIKLQRGDLAGALRLMSGALQARPKSPEVLLDFAAVLDALGRYDDAITVFDQVLSIKRRSPEAHNNRGTVLDKMGRDEEALESFNSALAIKPGSAEILTNQASVLSKLGRHAEALKSFERVVTIKPDHAQAHIHRGVTLADLNRFDEALACYDRALAIAPDFVEAINNRGHVLEKLGRPDEALACYERALAINPAHAEILYNQSNALAALGRHQEALVSCAQATALKPAHANAQWNEAILRLRLGDFAGGWKKYEWRWKRDGGAKKLRNFTQPLWLGQDSVAGNTVLLHHEQGLGDTIQFARYATLLAQRDARVLLEVQPPLKSLLSHIGGGVQVIGRGEDIPRFDLHCPLLSLPLACRTDLGTIPTDVPYLAAPDASIERWKARLPQGKQRVGLVWSGNATHKDDHNRSIALARLAPLFDTPDIAFVSLQKELRDSDAATLAADPRLTDLGSQFEDFSDTAAVIAQLDLVIAVDTAVAHLAGALGKPVWILLPFCPDWRWLLDRSDSPWYPTARLFRQPRVNDWDSVIAQVSQELRARN
jgi:tetratricopeptide (TPR) repeat protein